MKKHRVERFLSSLFGHHIHHDHSQVLEGKKDIDQKIERILELIGAQENSGNLEGEAEIVPFIEEFYENYKTLYGKYHHLVEKIKEHPNKELNGDISSSSDSDSSDSESDKSKHGKKESSKHNGKEHGKHKVSMDEYLELQGELEQWKNRSEELEMQSGSLLARLHANERMLIETRKFFLALENGFQSTKQSSRPHEVEDEKANIQLSSSQQKFDVNQKLTDVSKEHESLISKMALAQASFDEVKAERDSMNDAIKKLQNENMALKEQMTAASLLEVENEKLKLQLETCSQQLIDVNQKLTAVSKENDSLTSQMALAQASIDEVKAERDSLNDSLKQLQNENMVLKEEMAEARDQAEDLNKKLVTASEEKDKLDSEHASALGMINKAEKTIEELKLEANTNLTAANEKASEISELRSTIDELNLKLDMGSQQLTDMSQQLATLKEENCTLNSKVLTTSIQLQDFQTITEKIKTECELLKDSELKLVGINEELMQENRMKNEEFDALSSKHREVMDKAQLAEEQIEKLSLDLNHVTEEKSELSKSHEGLKQDLEASILKLSQLEEKLEVVSAEKHALSGDYEVLALEKSFTMNRLNDTLKAVEELTTNRDLFKKELDILQQDITAVREDLRIEAEKVTDLQGQLVVSNEEKTKAVSKLIDVEKLSEDLRSERDSLNDAINQLQNENMVLKEQMKVVGDQVEDLNRRLVIAIEEKDRLDTAHSSALSMIDKAEKTSEDLTQQVADLSQQLATLKEENHTLYSEVHTCNTQLQEFQTTIDKLKAECELLKDSELKLVGINEELTQETKIKNEEFDALSSKYNKGMDKIKLAEQHIEKLLLDLNHVNDQKSEVSKSHEGLKQDLQASSFKVSELESKLEIILAEKHALSGEYEVLDSERSVTLNRLNDALEMIEELTVQRDLFKNELDNLKEELQTATLKVSELENQLEGILAEKHALSGEYEALASERLVAVNRLNDTDKMVEELTIERDRFKDEVDKLQQEIATMREELHVQVEKVTDLLTQLTKSEDEKTNVLSKLFDVEKWSEDLRIEKESLDGKIVMLQNEIVSLKQELEQKVNQGVELQSQLTSTTEEKTMLFNKLSETGKENEELKIEKQLLNEQILISQEDAATLMQSLESEKRTTAELDKKLACLTQENDALGLENAATGKKLEDTEKIIINLKNDLNNIVNKVNDKQSENDELIIENRGLKSELEAVYRQKNDLSRELATAKEECSTLRFGITDVESKMQDTKKSIEQLRSDYDCLNDDKSKLLKTVEDLKIDLRAKDDEIGLLSFKLSEFVEENKLARERTESLVIELQKLNDENSKLSTDIETLKVDFNLSGCKLSEMENLLKVTQTEKDEIGQQNAAHLERSELSEKLIENLKIETEHLRYLFSESEVRCTNLNKSLSDKEKEKDLLVAENLKLLERLQQAEDFMKKAEMEVEGLKEEFSRCQQVENDLFEKNATLLRSLAEKGNELSALQDELNNVQKETSSQITSLMTRLNDLQLELDTLHIQKCEMEEQRTNLINEISESKVLMDNLKSELTERLSVQQSVLNEKTCKFEELRESHVLLEGRLHETSLELETALAMLKELNTKNETIGRLESVERELKIEKEQLEEKHKELSDNLRVTDEEKINAEKDIIRLQGQVDTLEVQLRLANRKLKITETEQREKGINYERRIEELQENQKNLEATLMTFQREKNLLETVFENIKDATEKEIANLGMSSQSLASLIMEKCNKFEARVSECCVQLQRMKEILGDILSKNKELNDERSELRFRVKYKEGVYSMLKEETDSLQLKLEEKTKEEEKLKELVNMYEKKITELETLLRVKEEAASYKDEEKREAIRQLCILIEYHRENYIHLYQSLSSKFTRPRS